MPRRPRYLSEFAPAKINLTLHVTGQGTGGYHALHSLMVFADVGDVVRARMAHETAFSIIGPFAADVPGDDNLVIRSARALVHEMGRHDAAHLVLEKHLPVASGMGGGSSDAAATLRLLTRVWGGNVSDATLHTLAAALGSDVPACLSAVPLYASGRGEILAEAANIPTLHAVLVNPGIPLPTADVFRHYAASAPQYTSPATYAGGDFMAWLAAQRNDLEPVAIALCPDISRALAALRAQNGCELARLSGSGATCFGLFDSAQKARNAAVKIAAMEKKWWVRSCVLSGSDHAVDAPEDMRRYG